ncbi:MAG: TAT-variant-translocated molybdopterin oxidoreductase, partial [Acidobacteriota bacterium]|nr:TAT-variant-translocated molybdopterin oxidoreductase [Acidobacteriota bacterium]
MAEEKRYWQSLEELRHDPAVEAAKRQELASGATLWEAAGLAAAEAAEAGGESRRDFLKLMGFSLAAATTAACTRIPERKAVPLVDQPAELVAGAANYYATTCAGCAAGCGLLVKTRDGRPIKIEGNPDSPLSGGGTCAVGQATVLSLYDDQRLKGPLWDGKPVTWEEADSAIAPRLQAIAARRGGIVLLSSSAAVVSPSTRQLIAEWRAHFPGSRHVVYDPISATALRLANDKSFGTAVVPHYRFDQAKLIVGLEADFLGTWLSPVEFTRQYARSRKLAAGSPAMAEMTRHIQIESGLSLSGSNADLRIPVHPGELGAAALVLLGRVAARAGVEPPSATAAAAAAHFSTASTASTTSTVATTLLGVADELWRHRGSSLLV